MTFKFNNVYIGSSSTVVGPYEKSGPLSNYYDKRYNDLSFGCKTWEQAEIKMIRNSINILLRKIKNNIEQLPPNIPPNPLQHLFSAIF